MLTRDEAISACLKMDGAVLDFPFGDFEWAVMRHGPGGKSFALIFERGGVVNVNVKAPPADCVFLSESVPAIIPAYHMNKRHWIGILLNGTLRDEDILSLIAQSYELTLQKSGARRAKGAKR